MTTPIHLQTIISRDSYIGRTASPIKRADVPLQLHRRTDTSGQHTVGVRVTSSSIYLIAGAFLSRHSLPKNDCLALSALRNLFPSTVMNARLVSVAWALNFARAFYLPGVAPREYESGEKVELKVVLIF